MRGRQVASSHRQCGGGAAASPASQRWATDATSCPSLGGVGAACTSAATDRRPIVVRRSHRRPHATSHSPPLPYRGALPPLLTARTSPWCPARRGAAGRLPHPRLPNRPAPRRRRGAACSPFAAQLGGGAPGKACGVPPPIGNISPQPLAPPSCRRRRHPPPDGADVGAVGGVGGSFLGAAASPLAAAPPPPPLTAAALLLLAALVVLPVFLSSWWGRLRGGGGDPPPIGGIPARVGAALPAAAAAPPPSAAT